MRGPAQFSGMHERLGKMVRGVFIRKAKARLGIQELFGPSLGRVFGKFREAGIQRGREVLVANLQHELDYAGTGGSVEIADDADS